MILRGVRDFRSARILIVIAIISSVMARPRTLVLGGDEKVSLVTDWSHRHVVYSAPKSFVRAFHLSGDSRYVQQWVRRNAERKRHHHHDHEWFEEETGQVHGDWSMYLGNGGTTGDGVFPAKFSFDVTTANCGSSGIPDFVVFNTSLAGSATPSAAFDTGTFTAEPNIGDTVTITNGAASLILTAGAVTSGTTFAVSATIATNATNLAAAINSPGNGSSVGASAAAAGTVVTVTATTAGLAGNSITAAMNMTGFAWSYANFVDGSAGQASIVAFDNLYSGCGGTVPSTYWAYNTGGKVVTSPSLAGDGSQVAFIQTDNTTGKATLVLLKWAASITDAANNPTTLAAVTNANYPTCSTPCMTTITFSGSGTPTDTNSSPFYDFAPGSDTLYAGDNQGHLHKFTGVFRGTPAESGAPWPVTLTANIRTTGPVFDFSSGKVFVADDGGFLYAVDASTGAVVKSGEIDNTNGIREAPLLDSTNGQIYIFAADDTSDGMTGVTRFTTSFAAGNSGSQQIDIGVGGTSRIHSGAFDNAFYSGGAGNLYVCGNAGGNPTLYQIPVTATGVLSAANTGPSLATATPSCSPITEVYNPNAAGGTTDWIFLSVQASGTTTPPISCPSAAGCMMSFDVTSGAVLTSAKTTAATSAVSGGTSGIVVDNTIGAGILPGASQVYYSTLTTGTCATSGGSGGCGVQASQSALQ
jgi:hypothetical protein